jgi:hypothetical protein
MRGEITILPLYAKSNSEIEYLRKLHILHNARGAIFSISLNVFVTAIERHIYKFDIFSTFSREKCSQSSSSTFCLHYIPFSMTRKQQLFVRRKSRKLISLVKYHDGSQARLLAKPSASSA